MHERLEDALLEAPLPLPELGGLRESVHVFERDSLLAVNTALACQRPLLVRGEPGVGKSQLARAVAVALGRVFVSVFVDARTESHELLWFHDAVTRLAEAQVHSKGKDVAERLARRRYMLPRPLWWALDWKGALHQAKEVAAIKEPPPRYEAPCDPAHGVVLLIDEIDKADSSVPNGLLECLGQRTFTVPGLDQPVRATGPSPLVILTTNEDRVLPDAFVRRCVVLHLRAPDPDEYDDVEAGALVDWLVSRGAAHFPALGDTNLLEEAAKLLVKDRRAARSEGFCPPGLAEYVDLLTAVAETRSAGKEIGINDVAPFVLRKHVDPRRRRQGPGYAG